MHRLTFLLILVCAGCATSPYRIADRPAATTSPAEFRDMRSQKQRDGWSDRSRKFYALGDSAVFPDRVALLRESLAGSSAKQVVLLQYDIHIFAGRLEGRSGAYSGGLLGGLVTGIVEGLANPVDAMAFTDVVMISIALEIDGRRVFVAEAEPFEGLSDMPVARAAVRKANARVLARLSAMTQTPNLK